MYRKAIIISYPEKETRVALVSLISECRDSLVARGWDGFPVREAASLRDVVAMNKDELGLIITHIDDVRLASPDIACIRQLRMNGSGAPLIAISYSAKDAHRVFGKSGHALLTYTATFSKRKLEELIIGIKTISVLKGFLNSTFGDITYLKALTGRINHELPKNGWELITLDVSRIETCFGDKAGETLVPLKKMLDEKNTAFEDWHQCLKNLETEVLCRTKS